MIEVILTLSAFKDNKSLIYIFYENFTFHHHHHHHHSSIPDLEFFLSQLQRK